MCAHASVHSRHTRSLSVRAVAALSLPSSYDLFGGARYTLRPSKRCAVCCRTRAAWVQVKQPRDSRQWVLLGMAVHNARRSAVFKQSNKNRMTISKHFCRSLWVIS